MRNRILIVLLTLFLYSSCDSVDNTFFSGYPEGINALTQETLTELNQRYHSENNGQLCSTLNQFGFTGYSRVLFINDINPCTQREVLRVEITRTDTLLQTAMEALYRNREFTLVNDTTLLEVIESTPLEGCTICEGPGFNNVVIGWKFTFANQRQENLLVSDSRIAVFLDANGVNRIWGNWYPEFPDPGLLNIGYLQAQSLFEGLEIDLEPLIGRDSVFVITPAVMNDMPYQSWFPYITRERLEFRKAWNIPIDFSVADINGFIGRVDIMDGKILDLEATGLNDGPLPDSSLKILVDN